MNAFSTCFDFVRVAMLYMLKKRKWEIAEKFQSTFLLIYWYLYLPSCYFIYNASRDTVAEKEFGIVMPMTLEPVLVRDSRNKKWSKVIFNKNL